MILNGILSAEAVRPSLSAGGKKRLFQSLAEIAHLAYGVDADVAAEALQERESLGPTGVGRGVALPHARIPGLTRMAGCFARLEKPIAFGAPDRQPVDLVFALFAPAGSGVGHLKALASVSRIMRDRQLCAKLRANADSAVIHALLTESSSRPVAA